MKTKSNTIYTKILASSASTHQKDDLVASFCFLLVGSSDKSILHARKQSIPISGTQLNSFSGTDRALSSYLVAGGLCSHMNHIPEVGKHGAHAISNHVLNVLRRLRVAEF
jgi:hypothetical protein